MTSGSEAGPYKFQQQDLQSERLIAGAEQTLADFFQWRDSNPDLIAEHVDQHTDQLQVAITENSRMARLGRRFSHARMESFEREMMTREIGFFCVYNVAEVPEPGVVERFRDLLVEGRQVIEAELPRRLTGDAEEMLAIIERHVPALASLPERIWLGERLTRLHRLLPESVIQEGAMGKVLRTIVGVLAIGAYDTLDESNDVKKEHLTRILPAAYAYGASYPIIDDTLQDSHYISRDDLHRYHSLILEGLRTGHPIDASDIPDHPLAEELLRLYDSMLRIFPFQEYPHLYHAAESMYLAQHRDAHKTVQAVTPQGLASLYPDIFIKASMSRVIANIIGRREVGEDYYERGVNVNFSNQFRDDLADSVADKQAGRLSLFTYPVGPDDSSPLYDLFAYSAYVAHEVYGNNPKANAILERFGATRLSEHLSSNPGYGERLLRTYCVSSEVARFIMLASGLSPRVVQSLRRGDIQLEKYAGEKLRDRNTTDVDPRTYISDKLGYINTIVGDEYIANSDRGDLGEVIAYAMKAGGKRLRPALTLMLAESLGVEHYTVEPLLKSIELFHTASLIFDDLPAQDNAQLRRGRPTTHIAFGEDKAQLAGISMISLGFGELAKLARYYPAERVAEVVEYCGAVLGPERLCRGQVMDLRMAQSLSRAADSDIVDMYALKTSTMLEAALVPLMMLKDSPAADINLIKKYAYHAGIVFQIRDDILDVTATAQDIGKDTDNDKGKVNIVRLHGQSEAERLLQTHLDAAMQACQGFSFNANLLEGVVAHFAKRNK